LIAVAACATSVDDPEPATTPPASDDAGPVTPGVDAGVAVDASDGAAPDGAPRARCGDGWCYDPLPDATTWFPDGFGWRFAAAWADPILGAWALAGDGNAPPRLLHFDGTTWVPVHAVVDPSATKASAAKGIPWAMTGDGKGHIVAVAVDADGVTLAAHLDASGFRVKALPYAMFGGSYVDPRGAWLRQADEIWIASALTIVHQVPSGTAGSVTVPDGSTWRIEAGLLPAGTFGGITMWSADASSALIASTAMFAGGTDGFVASVVPAASGAPTVTVTPLPPFGAFTSMVTTAAGGVAPRAWVAANYYVAQVGLDAGAVVLTPTDGGLPSANAIGSAAPGAWAVGGAGNIYRDDGTAWKAATPVIDGVPATANLTAVASLPSGETWVFGNNVVLHRRP
jgi:hypothetical protein